MFSKSVFSPLTLQLRSQLRGLHISPVSLKYPIGKTGKLLPPYIRFANEKRPEVLQQEPNISVPEVGRKLGELWRALPESERQRYKDEYSQAKSEKSS